MLHTRASRAHQINRILTRVSAQRKWKYYYFLKDSFKNLSRLKDTSLQNATVSQWRHVSYCYTFILTLMAQAFSPEAQRYLVLDGSGDGWPSAAILIKQTTSLIYTYTRNNNNAEGCVIIHTGVCTQIRHAVCNMWNTFMFLTYTVSFMKWFVYFHIFLLHIVSSLCMTATNTKWERLLVVFREYWGCSGSWAILSAECEWVSSLWEKVIKQMRICVTCSLFFLMIWTYY